MRLSIVLAALLITATAQATSYVPQFPKGLEEFTTIEGIKFKDASGTSNPPINSEILEVDQRFQR